MTKNRKVENLLSQPSHLCTVNVARFARNVEWDFSVIFKHRAFWQKQLLFCLGLYLVEGVKCVRVFKCRKNQWGFPPSLMPSVNSIAARSWKSIVMNRGWRLLPSRHFSYILWFLVEILRVYFYGGWVRTCRIGERQSFENRLTLQQ